MGERAKGDGRVMADRKLHDGATGDGLGDG